MTKPSTALYKLIILYMLNRVDFPLTKTQICDFVLGKEYTGYLTLQACFGELIDDKMITAQSFRNRTHLTITEEGKKNLYYCENQINAGIKQDIIAYLKENALQLRNEVSVFSNYGKAISGEYEAHLTAKDKGITLLDITISVPDEDTAITVCANWDKKNQVIYQTLIEELFDK